MRCTVYPVFCGAGMPGCGKWLRPDDHVMGMPVELVGPQPQPGCVVFRIEAVVEHGELVVGTGDCPGQARR